MRVIFLLNYQFALYILLSCLTMTYVVLLQMLTAQTLSTSMNRFHTRAFQRPLEYPRSITTLSTATLNQSRLIIMFTRYILFFT